MTASDITPETRVGAMLERFPELEALDRGQLFELITPLVPAPMIDIARQKGFLAWSREESPSLIRTCFTRDPQDAPPTHGPSHTKEKV